MLNKYTQPGDIKSFSNAILASNTPAAQTKASEFENKYEKGEIKTYGDVYNFFHANGMDNEFNAAFSQILQQLLNKTQSTKNADSGGPDALTANDQQNRISAFQEATENEEKEKDKDIGKNNRGD